AGVYLQQEGFFKASLFIGEKKEPLDSGSAKNRLADRRKASAEVDEERRAADFRKAQAELLLSPETSLATLRRIISKDSTDKVGRDAVDVVVTYYKQTQRPADAGRLLMEAKRPAEASKFFLSDPPSYSEAETALYAAYQSSKEPTRRDFIMKDIELLLGVVS